MLAVVVSTAFWTAKGSLVRSILFPKALNVKLWKDAIKFVLALAVISFAGVAYSLAINLINAVSTSALCRAPQSGTSPDSSGTDCL